MDCSEIRRFLHAYIDLEFDEREQIEFELHLAQCTCCREEVNYYRALRRTLRKNVCSNFAPVHLEALVRKTVEQEVRVQRGWFHLSMATVGAFALALGTFLWSPNLSNTFIAGTSRGELPKASAQNVSFEPNAKDSSSKQGSRVLATKQFLRGIIKNAKRVERSGAPGHFSMEGAMGSNQALQRAGLSNDEPTISLRECDNPYHVHQNGTKDKHPWCKMMRRPNRKNQLAPAILQQ